MISGDLLYDFPFAGYLIFAVFLFLLLFRALYAYRQYHLEIFFPAAAPDRLLVPRSPLIFWCKVGAFCAAWALLSIALMQPKGNPRYPEGAQPEETKAAPAGQQQDLTNVRRTAHDVIFLIDASASMSVPDARFGKTRLDFAKEIADEIASNLNGESASLYAFTSQPSMLVPPTMDYLYLRLLLRQVQINEGDVAGTNLTTALREVKKQNYPTPTRKLHTLILLSDGGDTQLEALTGNQKQKAADAIASLVDDAEKLHLRVFTIGMGSRKAQPIPGITFQGTAVPSALDDSILRQISTVGRGHSYFANDYSAPELASAVLNEMKQDSSALYQTESEELAMLAESQPKELVYDLYFQIFLGFAIFLLAFALYFPDATARRELVNNPGLYGALLMAMMLASGTTLAADASQAMREAAANVEAGNYTQAIKEYRHLLTEDLPAWQKGVIQYNIGTALLEAGRLDEAITQFNAIPLSADSSPLLIKRIKGNVAAAYLRQGQHLMDALSEKGSLSQEDAEKAIYLFRESLGDIRKARAATCELSKLEGIDVCPPTHDLQMARAAAKQNLSFLLEGYWPHVLPSLTLTDTAPFMQAELISIQHQLDLLGNPNMPPELKQKYLDNFAVGDSTWKVLWPHFTVTLRDSYHEEKNFTEMQRHLSDAEAAYTKLLVDIKAGNLKSAAAALATSSSSLNELMRLVWRLEPSQTVVQKLLSLFQNAWEQVIIPEELLKLLQNELNQVAILLREQHDIRNAASLNRSLDQAKHNVASALTNVQNDQRQEARLFIFNASHEIKRILRLFNPEEMSTPKRILENAIDDLKHALTVSRLSYNLSVDRSLQHTEHEDVKTMLADTQINTLSTASPFLKTVLTQQIAAYQAPKNSGGKNPCQCKPWDEVLPLFNKGESAAALAARMLQEKNPNQRAAMLKQELALKYWKEALDKLNRQRQGAKEEESPQENQPQPSQNEEQQAEGPGRPASKDEALRLLLEMNQQDSKPQPAIHIQSKEGERPW